MMLFDKQLPPDVLTVLPLLVTDVFPLTNLQHWHFAPLLCSLGPVQGTVPWIESNVFERAIDFLLNSKSFKLGARRVTTLIKGVMLKIRILC